MCGILGTLDPSGDFAALEAALAVGSHALAHRGPDDHGQWGDAEAGILLGHRRLSILDLSPLGHQPMHSTCGRYVVAYNGEIYNFAALRDDLTQAGDSFRGHSDTEVLLAGFARWGAIETCRRANGMFAFALWDRAERVLTLGRDRFGQKPLYYGEVGSRFVFGSEIKALRPLLPTAPEIDREAVTLFLRHGYVPGPRSIYRGLRKLPAGTLVTLSADGAISTPVPYWSAVEAAGAALGDPFGGDEHEAAEALEVLLADAVGKCMVADVPLGAFLSGGVDSSTVVALMQAQSTRPVRTFSIGFAEARYDESKQAAAVARHLGTDHTELTVTEQDALDVIPRLPDLYCEPFADSSQVPTYLLSKLTREHVTVSLSGDGGDEVFGGYNRYVWGRDLGRLIGAVPAGARRAACKMARAVPVALWDRVGALAGGRFRVAQPGDKLHKLASVADAVDAETAYLGLTSLWHDPTGVTGVAEPDSAVVAGVRALPEAGLVHRMMLADTLTYLPDDILVKVDRASMAVSLESRIPLLDHRVFEFAWRLPLAMKLRDGKGKWLLRQVLYKHVPAELIDRPKMGFGIPLGDWLRGALREWAESLLDDTRIRQHGLLDPVPIRRVWQEHMSGRRNWAYPLWTVLMLQAWMEGRA